ncbi:hypothetical protein OBBRIDRAFT_791937 [Obba rivulosa]|uniref:Uncharacterized protein n=1 Tax=Obba rivulosa TaxID=1052685 RepID=A0A8E2B0Q3_9APHY|nr:hypothetical protein OBBRIDRAFT_791937 [Obba rivulosa]
MATLRAVRRGTVDLAGWLTLTCMIWGSSAVHPGKIRPLLTSTFTLFTRVSCLASCIHFAYTAFRIFLVPMQSVRHLCLLLSPNYKPEERRLTACLVPWSNVFT